MVFGLPLGNGIRFDLLLRLIFIRNGIILEELRKVEAEFKGGSYF